MSEVKFNTNNLQDWLKLLEHSKTAATAACCLVYIGNALSNDGKSPVNVQISKSQISSRILNDERSTCIEHGEIILNKRTSIKLTLSDGADPSHDIDQYARQMVQFINSYSKLNNSWWPDLNPVRAASRYYRSRKEKPAWIDIRRSKDTEQSVYNLTTFLVKGYDGYCTEGTAQILLNAIISIGHGYHIGKASPLHEAVKAQDLDAVIMLLSHGVDVNNVDNRGFTSLYYSIEHDFPLITKTLLLFGSDLSMTRKEDVVVTVVMEDAKSDTMRKIIENVTTPSNTPWDLSSKHAHELLKPNRREGEKTHLLSLDGGGIRGLVLTTILTELDREIPGIVNHIKWIAGTSTGSILALALAQGKTIDECRNIYFKFKDVVFTFSKASSAYLLYDTDILESFLQDIFQSDGEQTTMHQLGEMSGKKIISTSTDTSEAKLRAVLFKSYWIHSHFYKTYREERVVRRIASELQDEFYLEPSLRVKRDLPITPRRVCDERKNPVEIDYSKMSPHDQHPARVRVCDVARCTSAAPTFFAPCGQYIDGGIMRNNPTVVLLREWAKYNNALKDLIEEHGENHEDEKPMNLGAVISIGTGRKAKQEKNVAEEDDGATAKAEEWFHDLFEGLRFGKKFFKEIGKSDGDVVQDSKAQTDEHNGAYFRFTPTFDEEIDMKETNNETLIEMMWKTKMYMRDQVHYIAVLKKLIQFGDYPVYTSKAESP